MAEQLDPVDEARSRPREVGGCIHGHDTRADRRKPLAMEHRLGRRLLGVVAAGHRDHDLGRRRLDLRPLDRARLLPGHPEHVVAAGELDHLRDPVPAREHGVEPFERRDARPRVARDGELDLLDPLGGLLGQRLARLRHARRLGEPRDVGQDLAERGRVERDHLGMGGEALRHGADVVERDGAYLADRLGHDQIHVEALERVLVELVERLAAARALTHGGVDLRRPRGPPGSRCV